MCLAIPGRIVEIIDGEGLERRARIDTGGTEQEVSLGMVSAVQVGDHIVSHSGFALRIVPGPTPQKSGQAAPGG
ncbi:MAG: HypC/HybG/HupF family hydrogenase formation chaperone [Acidimicrobiia bacterium]|nr:HypC/HybG/HupF family hydrogenase formation chaperone [Acidimicrobiia bacterium]